MKGIVLNQNSCRVLSFREEEAVKLIRYAAVAQNSSHKDAGALQARQIDQVQLRIVQ